MTDPSAASVAGMIFGYSLVAAFVVPRQPGHQLLWVI